MIFLFAIALIVIGAIFKGFVLTYLWDWFIVPFGLDPISIPLAIGLSLIIGYLTIDTSSSKSDTEETQSNYISRLIGHSVLLPFVILLIGYIIHLFM